MNPKPRLLIPASLKKFLLTRRWIALMLGFAALFSLTPSASAAPSYSLHGDPPYNFGTQAPISYMGVAIQTILGKPITSVGSLVDANPNYPTVIADSDLPPYTTYFGPATNGVIKNLNLGTVILSGIVRGELLYNGTTSSCGGAQPQFILRVFTSTQYHDVLVKVFSCNGPAIANWSFYRVSGSRPINPYTLSANPNYTFGSAQPTVSTMGTAVELRLGKPVSTVSALPGENTAFAPVLGQTVGSSPIFGPSSGGVVRNLSAKTNVITGIVSAQIRFAGTVVVNGTALNQFVLRVFTVTQFSDILVRAWSNDANGAVWDFYQISALRPISGIVANLSARAQVLTGNNVEIAGFIIGGTGNRQVLIRGLGPSLAGGGLTGVLGDPVLSLYDSTGALITSNNNWKDTDPANIEATGLQPTDDLESAILRDLSPGAYTAVLEGNGGGTGIGLAEVYSISGPGQLSNLSARASVGTGPNVLIGGLNAQSTSGGPQVLIRAIGPSLTQYGVQGAMQDPVLEFYDSNGALITSNDNWRASQQTDIQATGLAPTDDRESAILTNLVPGAFTAVVTGSGGTTGVASLEVYKFL
jgi:hypothetical protein